jgi:hypothetical protein
MTNPSTHADLLTSLSSPDPGDTLDEGVLRAEPIVSHPSEDVAAQPGAIIYDPENGETYGPGHYQDYDRDHDRWGHDRWGHDRDHHGHHRDHDRDDWGHHRDHHRDDWGHHGHHGHHGQDPGPVYQTEPDPGYHPDPAAEDVEVHIDPIESYPTSEDVVIDPEPEPDPVMTEEPVEVHADDVPIA